MRTNLAREIVSRQRNLKKNAYLFNAQALSYEMLFRRASGIAASLRDAGVVSRQRVLICLYDTPAVSELFLAALSIGAIPVVANPRLPRESLAHIVADSGASVLACEYDNLETVFAVCRAGTPAAPLRLVLQDSYAASSPGGLDEGGESDGGDGGLLRLSDMAQPDRAFEFVDIEGDDAAFWQYTSGTTGRPKAVQHCSATMIENTESFAVRTHGFSADDIFYSAAKMFFGYGFGASFFFPLLLGATAVLDSSMPANDYAVIRNIAKFRPTAVFCSPALYASLLPHAGRIKPYLGERTTFISAGAALPKSVQQRWRDALGADIYDGIGSTEMGHIFLSNRRGATKAGSTGHPIGGYEVKLVPADEVRPDQEGRRESGILWVKGAHPHLGYWNQPQANRGKFIDGWCVTGDLFERDAEGFYTYQGRVDDLFKSNGIWVAPLAIESEILARLPQVLECALVPYSGAGELAEPALFCAIDTKQCSKADGVAAVRAIAGEICEKHSLPKLVIALDGLPRNDNGKVSRGALCRLDAAGLAAA